MMSRSAWSSVRIPPRISAVCAVDQPIQSGNVGFGGESYHDVMVKKNNQHATKGTKKRVEKNTNGK
jgi:hypothetical protein